MGQQLKMGIKNPVTVEVTGFFVAAGEGFEQLRQYKTRRNFGKSILEPLENQHFVFNPVKIGSNIFNSVKGKNKGQKGKFLLCLTLCKLLGIIFMSKGVFVVENEVDERYCAECETKLDTHDKCCPNCGCTSKMVYASISMNLNLGIHIDGMKAKNNKYKHKTAWEFIDKDTIRKDDGVTPVHHYRLIDRSTNEYLEIVTDKATGDIIHKCEEPLTDHWGHGNKKYGDKKE